MADLPFWLLTGVAVGFVLANTWELILGALFLWLGAETFGALEIPESNGSGPTGTQILRWFIRTGLVILGALVAWIMLPFREYWSQLLEHPDRTAILIAAAVCALLSLVLMLWLDPLNRLLREMLREGRAS